QRRLCHTFGFYGIYCTHKARKRRIHIFCDDVIAVVVKHRKKWPRHQLYLWLTTNIPYDHREHARAEIKDQVAIEPYAIPEKHVIESKLCRNCNRSFTRSIAHISGKNIDEKYRHPSFHKELVNFINILLIKCLLWLCHNNGIEPNELPALLKIHIMHGIVF